MTATPPALHVLILAAGEGKRMRSRRPKVLMPVAGRPMLTHVIEAARSLDPAGIHIVYGHAGEQVRAAFADQADLSWVEQSERRGTGHAVQQALPVLPEQGRVLVLYGDVPLIRSETLRALLAAPGTLAVLGARLDDPSGYGRLILDAEGRVEAIVEHKDASEAQRAVRWINTGLIACDAARLRAWLAEIRADNAQGEYYLTDIFALAARDGERAACVEVADASESFGANDPLQLSALEALYRRREARALMQAGVRLADPARIDVRGRVAAGMDIEIDIDVVLEGAVELGDEVQIGPFCRIRNSKLAAGTVIHGHCELDGVISEGPCTIGPFARLRPGTRLAAGVHIGNFVETKNTTLGEGSKANHLSYLGDAVIGAKVNIGAGTITCNYDGANKHRTTIEDGAFIGSNSALVAPVTVGAGATLGAGSTLTRNAPAGQLTVARARQQSFADWKRPSKSRD
ncbi:bifunctional UDP-N-acetylglucosamine diphosphorylase/glucosamine-1-phosphate N-acetyltransferase GlmU [uncultured Aquimonas sp.]|uniref:bifunctional UDP-N-acetylglucosamine diphosphorylase/glucosamine-1-phosphate N-acetyltransferase GlmU n=1 Tax=uncultured Aquimonas sp. TaxID=385483 RepID=UPI00086C2717|nr:bifunctional UDP-N-acetylglucosamine diphosphorylase/glucosamine-1-phosphate N-acetyltransferase GlmU [uncultured Aquimonas sp.]ODU43415.1 MAG: UDP-N-acetylglucosamine diphosphorylase/glucosamine-1-phosphate N-acetyltransferase [Xanthomonadaceae bacterium SCN 69-123]